VTECYYATQSAAAAAADYCPPSSTLPMCCVAEVRTDAQCPRQNGASSAISSNGNQQRSDHDQKLTVASPIGVSCIRYNPIIGGGYPSQY